jgi:hypothetical protein
MMFSFNNWGEFLIVWEIRGTPAAENWQVAQVQAEAVIAG